MKQIPTLEVKNISVSFTQYTGFFKKETLTPIRDLSLTLYPGEIVAVVGASGSGKSLLAHAVMGILPYNAKQTGSVRFQGEPLTTERLSVLRGQELVLVPQSVSYLDPLMKVGAQIGEGSGTAAKEKTAALIRRYHLKPETANRYPFELSGGMARRILIATATAGTPKLVIADEPTPGLDLPAAKEVLSHFRELAEGGAAVLLITHDLELAAETADKIVVFYGGTTLEEAFSTDFSQVDRLRHPYTKALWRAMPQNGFQGDSSIQPRQGAGGTGCPFQAGCPNAREACTGEIPYRPENGGFVRCVGAEDVDSGQIFAHGEACSTTAAVG